MQLKFKKIFLIHKTDSKTFYSVSYDIKKKYSISFDSPLFESVDDYCLIDGMFSGLMKYSFMLVLILWLLI